MNYNPIASLYDSFERTAVTVLKIGYPAVLEMLGDVSNKRILDYGCGTGTFSRILAAGDAIVNGVDVSVEMIHVARSANGVDTTYHHIRSGDLGFFPDSVFDHVVSNFVLCTIPTQAEIIDVMKSIKRVLKPGGSFVIMNSDWERSNGKEFISFRLDYIPDLISGTQVTATIKSDPPMPMKDFFWSKADYTEMLHVAGFMHQVISEPLGTPGDDWLDETVFPPYFIISSVK